MVDSVKVRYARPDEEPSYLGLLNYGSQDEHGWGLTPNEVKFYKHLFKSYVIEDGRGGVAVAEDDTGRLRGVAVVGEDMNPFGPKDIVHFYGVYVDPSYRGDSIGLQLSHFLQKPMKDKGFTSVMGWVRLDNQTSYSIYSEAGGAPTAVRLEFQL